MRTKKQISPMLRKPSKINAFDITQRQKHLVFLRISEPFSKEFHQNTDFQFGLYV